MFELQNLLGLSEKRVVITAGANGIGFAIAKKLYHLGAKIAVCDIDEESLSIASHVLGHCPAMAADVSNVAAIDAFFHQVQSQLGGLDALINNAGIAGPTGNIKRWMSVNGDVALMSV